MIQMEERVCHHAACTRMRTSRRFQPVFGHDRPGWNLVRSERADQAARLLGARHPISCQPYVQ
jgi:hypothetical protein